MSLRYKTCHIPVWLCTLGILAGVLLVALLTMARGQDRLSGLKLSPAERAWLDGHPEIRFSPDPDFPPIEWLDDEGRYRGLAADFLAMVEVKTGIRFRLVPAKNWPEVLEKARTRQIDLLPACSPSKLRRKYLNFTRPHIVLPGVILAKNDFAGSLNLEKLRGLKVVVVDGYVWQDYLNEDLPDMSLLKAPSVSAALEMVSFGQAHAMVGDLGTATYYLGKTGISNLKVAGKTGYFTYLSFAVRKDWPLLTGILDKALASISPQESTAIVNKWMGAKTSSFWASREIRLAVGLVTGLLILLAIGFWAWNRSLRRQVGERTAQLKQELEEHEITGQALRESEEKFRSIGDNALDGVIMIDPQGKITFWNRAAEKIFGYSSQEALGLDLHTFLAPKRYHKDYLAAKDLFRKRGRGPVLGRTLELSALTKPGREIPIELSISALRLKGDWHAVGIVRDITERKDLERKLLQAHKMESVGTLAGGIAHDFNNILSAITGYSELALEDARRGKATPEELEQILRSADRASELVKQILTFSRGMEPALKPISLNKEITQVAKILERTIPKMIQVELRLAEGLDIINGDATQIEQVLINFAGNARDAMPGGGSLILETENVTLDKEYCRRHLDASPGDHVRLTVSDTGQGMEEHVLEQIYDPFFTTKKAGEGTGLGLAMVYGIVKSHGGHILAESTLGVGTTFSLYFPSYKKYHPADEGLEPEQVETAMGHETILLVDDEASLRRIGSQILGSRGYQTITASSGEEALEIYEKRGSSIDLVVLDLGMPGMGGLKCLGKLLQMDSGAKVVIASGYASKQTLGQTLESGASSYIAKPFKKADLLKVIREVLDNG